MKATIFTHQRDLSPVLEALEKKYGAHNLEVVGEGANWNSLTLTRRRLIGKSNLVLNVEGPGAKMEEMRRGLAHVFGTIPTDQDELRQKLLLRIAHFQTAIGLDAKSKLSGFEDALFAVAKSVKGLIFWDGNQMLTEKGKLILDFQGNSRVDDIEVYASAEAFDPDPETVSPDAAERKARSEEWLEDMAVPMNSHLPTIQSEAETELQSVEAVADRALALAIVALKGEGLEQLIVEQIYKDYQLEGTLSPKEQAFFNHTDPSQQDRVNFTWRYESLLVMLWALGHVEELGYPGGISDVQAMIKLIYASKGRAGLLANASLRDASEILEEADRIYRLHWAVVDARLRGQNAPADLEPGVVYERHYALNWLIGYQGSTWDEVSTNT